MASIEYDVVPAGSFARAFPLAIGGLILFASVFAIAATYDQPLVLVGTLPALFIGLSVVVVLAWA